MPVLFLLIIVFCAVAAASAAVAATAAAFFEAYCKIHRRGDAECYCRKYYVIRDRHNCTPLSYDK